MKHNFRQAFSNTLVQATHCRNRNMFSTLVHFPQQCNACILARDAVARDMSRLTASRYRKFNPVIDYFVKAVLIALVALVGGVKMMLMMMKGYQFCVFLCFLSQGNQKFLGRTVVCRKMHQENIHSAAFN